MITFYFRFLDVMITEMDSKEKLRFFDSIPFFVWEELSDFCARSSILVGRIILAQRVPNNLSITQMNSLPVCICVVIYLEAEIFISTKMETISLYLFSMNLNYHYNRFNFKFFIFKIQQFWLFKVTIHDIFNHNFFIIVSFYYPL